MREYKTPIDKVLWILGSSGGEMSIGRLRSIPGLKKAGLANVFKELERENRIVIRHRSVMLRSNY
jgi:hypothetical protein